MEPREFVMGPFSWPIRRWPAPGSIANLGKRHGSRTASLCAAKRSRPGEIAAGPTLSCHSTRRARRQLYSPISDRREAYGRRADTLSISRAILSHVSPINQTTGSWVSARYPDRVQLRSRLLPISQTDPPWSGYHLPDLCDLMPTFLPPRAAAPPRATNHLWWTVGGMPIPPVRHQRARRPAVANWTMLNAIVGPWAR